MSNQARFAIFTAVILIVAGVAALLPVLGLLGGTDEREATRSADVESPTDRAVSQLQQQSQANPDEVVSLTQLGFAYLQKARESGDPAFYSQADGVFQKALALDPHDSSGLLGASAVAAARHDFGRALESAQRALETSPGDPDAYGALGDALIELGRYDEAVVAFQRMLDTRPDLNAYVRVAYARELHGDVAGAVEMMVLAIEASRPGGETAAWVRSQLANLYFNSGNVEEAAKQYEASLDAFPGYVHALAGLARVAAANGDYDKAIGLYEQIVARQPVLEHVAALGDVYRAAGREEDAERQYELVAAIDALYEANGINTDLEMALFLADHGDPEKAIVQATGAYQLQSGSIRAADALSWALYKAGRFEEALTYSHQALRLGTKDALLLFHAGMINHGAGSDDAARALLGRAVEINAAFSVLYSAEAVTKLEALEGAVRR